METKRIVNKGYVIHCKVGFYELTQIGDWSLGGDENTAVIFSDRTLAEEIAIDLKEQDDFEVDIFEVRRETIFEISKL